MRDARRSSAVSGHKEQEVSLAVSTPNHHFTAVCSSLGSRWRSSPVAEVTNSHDEACGADVEKRCALSAGIVMLHKVLRIHDPLSSPAAWVMPIWMPP